MHTCTYHGYPIPLRPPDISAVDVRDIAEATAITLTADGYLGKTHNLIGPDVLSGSKVASIWSKLLGKDIRYTGEDLNAFEAQMGRHAPAWLAFDMRMMFQGYLGRGFASGDEDLATLTALLGHSPRSYEAFAKKTAVAW